MTLYCNLHSDDSTAAPMVPNVDEEGSHDNRRGGRGSILCVALISTSRSRHDMPGHENGPRLRAQWAAVGFADIT